MSSDLFDLTDRVAIVTGSTRGIGFASAKRMSEHGAKVVISGRKPEGCAQALAHIQAIGGEAIAVPCNIGRKHELQNLVEVTLAKMGSHRHRHGQCCDSPLDRLSSRRARMRP